MTPAQYKAAIAALGLSQQRAGVWLGIGKRTSQGYALGERPVPEPIEKLLLLMVKKKLKPEDFDASRITQEPITTLLRFMVKYKLRQKDVLKCQ